MGGARHPKPYNEGPRRQVTVPWKRRVLAKLEHNKKEKRQPSNPDQLMALVGAKKGSINNLLNIEKDQLSSTYVDEINAILEIDPPFLETDEDDEDFIRDAQLLRTLTRDARRDLMIIAQRMPKKPK